VAYSATGDVQQAVGGAARLTALADFDGNGVIDAGVVDAAIAEADALIDSYAHKRFKVPFAAPTERIKRLSAWLAAYNLRSARGMVTEDVQHRYEAEIEWLEGLRDGVNLPGVEPIPTKSEIVKDKAGDRDSTKAVGREKLKGWW
jgi:phage gp36-like protein